MNLVLWTPQWSSKMLRSAVKWELRRDKDRWGKKVLMKKVTLTCLWNTCYSLASQSDASILFLISTRSKIVIYRLLISQAEALLNCLGSLLSGEIEYPLYLFSVIYQTQTTKLSWLLEPKLKWNQKKSPTKTLILRSKTYFVLFPQVLSI